jgi:hypothetical protein
MKPRKTGPYFVEVAVSARSALVGASPVYFNIVSKYEAETGISAEVIGSCVYSLRTTAATNALSHDSDIAKVRE